MANTSLHSMQRSNKTKISGPTWIGRTQTGLINLLSGLLERNQCVVQLLNATNQLCIATIKLRTDCMFTFGKTAHAVRYIYYDKSLK